MSTIHTAEQPRSMGNRLLAPHPRVLLGKRRPTVVESVDEGVAGALMLGGLALVTAILVRMRRRSS